MLILVFGGSGSGKSAFAESYCVQKKMPDDTMYYLATMESCDDECNVKIQRHRELRKDKNFSTLEQPYDISESMFGTESSEHRVVLLECLTTLLTNEIYRDGFHYKDVFQKMANDIQDLYAQCRDLIIVSSDVFRSGETYTEETEGYIRQLAFLHEFISERADEVYEVVVGLPISLKGGNSSC